MAILKVGSGSFFLVKASNRSPPFRQPSCYPQWCYWAAWSTPKDLADSPCPQLPAFCLLACHPECPSQTAPAGLFLRSSSTRCSLAGVHRSSVGVNVCFFWARSGEFRHFKNEREKQQLQNKWLNYIKLPGKPWSWKFPHQSQNRSILPNSREKELLNGYFHSRTLFLTPERFRTVLNAFWTLFERFLNAFWTLFSTPEHI